MTGVILFDSVVVVVALVVGFFLHKFFIDRRLGDAQQSARRIVEVAERDAEARLKAADLQVKEDELKVRTELDREARRREQEIATVERRILAKEEQVARKLEDLDRRLNELSARDGGIAGRGKAWGEKETRLEAAVEEQRRKLEVVAGLTAEEARRQLMNQMEGEARREAALIGMRLEEEARETAHQKAKEVLATTIQRLAPAYTMETAVSIVDLPSDDMKGRIIGREGRNIRALELHTGVDLIVDDTPEAVIVSAYDPYRREIARLSLQRLIADGRIHPARIEEVVTKVKTEMEQHLKEEGEKACFEVGVHGLHPELVKLVGRMKYRTSYGQNW